MLSIKLVQLCIFVHEFRKSVTLERVTGQGLRSLLPRNALSGLTVAATTFWSQYKGFGGLAGQWGFGRVGMGVTVGQKGSGGEASADLPLPSSLFHPPSFHPYNSPRGLHIPFSNFIMYTTSAVQGPTPHCYASVVVHEWACMLAAHVCTRSCSFFKNARRAEAIFCACIFSRKKFST